MKALPQAELERLAMEAAQEVTGPGSVSKVAIEDNVDSLDRPAYHVMYLFHPERSSLGAGTAMIRIPRRLREKLEEHGDEHQLLVRFRGESYWAGRASLV